MTNNPSPMITSHSPITLVLADDHPIVLKGLREVIAREAAFDVVGEAHDGAEACDLIARHMPRIAVLDIDMPRMTGLEVAERIREEKLPVSVLILTVFDDESIFAKAMDLGVMGYILKDSAAIEIVRGITRVAQGEYFISPSLTGALLHKTRQTGPLVEQKLGLQLLTAAERRILRLIAEEKTSAEIAEELSISRKTVEHHRTNICAKLRLSGSFPLLRFAMEHKGNI